MRLFFLFVTAMASASGDRYLQRRGMWLQVIEDSANELIH